MPRCAELICKSSPNPLTSLTRSLLTSVPFSVAQAKTGTGKTLAFLIPTFQRLLEEIPELADKHSRREASSNDIKAIIMSPTRELAEQIGVEARKLAQNTGIVVQTAVGGTRKKEALWRMQREGCHILVATPGRLQDLLTDRMAGVEAPNLKAFVLDEADRMLDVGFSDDIREILKILPPVEKVDRQTLLFSATIPRDVVHLAKSLVKVDNFEFVQTIGQNDTPTHQKVPQFIVPCTSYENWFPAVLEISQKAIAAAKEDPEARPFKAIVFFSNTATVVFAHKVFRGTSLGAFGGVPMWDIHSKLTQPMRTRNAETFRRAKTGILFSSDVTARGMDFPGVTHVFQVGLPPDRDQYIHRVGRTGRAGAEGTGYLILAQDEIREARARLPGLPIKPDNSVESAKADLSRGEPSGEVEEYFQEIARGYKQTRPYEFNELYMSLLSQKFGRNLRGDDVVALLNNWSQYGLQRDEVPALSQKAAHNRGLSRVPGIRIGHNEDQAPEDSRGGGFGGRGGSSFGGSRNVSSSGGFGGFGGRGGDRGGFGGRGGDSFGNRGPRAAGSKGARFAPRGGSDEDRFGGRRGHLDRPGDRFGGRSSGGYGGSRNDNRSNF